MGCCFSKTQPPLPPPSKLPESDPSYIKPPPPLPLSPPVEEETVKEVLSETPTTKPPLIPKIPQEESNTPTPTSIEEDKNNKPKLPIPKIPPEESKIPLPIEDKNNKIPISVPASLLTEEISEDVSEICTLSESISTTTITTEKREDEDGEVQQRLYRSPSKIPRKRSFPGDSPGKQERGRKSPARRADPSPIRRNDNAVKSVSGTDVGQTTTRRRVSENNNSRPRRDHHHHHTGESSGRRSRSPATRVNAGGSRPGVGRSPSRRTGRSPARVPAVAPEKNQKPEESEETKEANPPANESIENPLVSMECFIFL